MFASVACKVLVREMKQLFGRFKGYGHQGAGMGKGINNLLIAIVMGNGFFIGVAAPFKNPGNDKITIAFKIQCTQVRIPESPAG